VLTAHSKERTETIKLSHGALEESLEIEIQNILGDREKEAEALTRTKDSLQKKIKNAYESIIENYKTATQYEIENMDILKEKIAEIFSASDESVSQTQHLVKLFALLKVCQ